MRIKDFRKLEKKINNYDFNDSYKGINIVMTILSYFGHLASIFLAFFFMSTILSTAIDNRVVVIVASLFILVGLELLKRDIFDKFSIQSLKDRSISKLFPLLFVSTLLIMASFYSTISGAKVFSTKEKKIEETKRENISLYSDSINLLYESKIVMLENQNLELFESNKQLDIEARGLPNELISGKDKIRKRIDKNNEQIDKNDNKVSLVKNERDLIISNHNNIITLDSDGDKKENSKNSLIFLIISTIIELVILTGVYFSEYYKFRSYKEFRRKIEGDSNYQKWILYDKMLSIVISKNMKMNEKIPSNKSIIDACKINDLIVLPKEVVSFSKLLVGLGIIKSSGPARYCSKNIETAQEILKRNFNVE